MPKLQATAVQILGPLTPLIRSERIVSMSGVIGWFSAKPRKIGAMEDDGTKAGLMKISKSKI